MPLHEGGELDALGGGKGGGKGGSSAVGRVSIFWKSIVVSFPLTLLRLRHAAQPITGQVTLIDLPDWQEEAGGEIIEYPARVGSNATRGSDTTDDFDRMTKSKL